MGVWIVALLVSFGLAARTAMVIAQRRQLRAVRPTLQTAMPAVTILKPLKGVDADLERNLESYFRLDYPEYEVLLGVQSANDPALAVAQRVAAANPHVPSRCVVDEREVGYNPKVNNLANLARVARHDVFWIADSNTRVAPDTLADLVAHLEQPGVGLVSSPFRGVSGTALGAALESLQLNTFVMGGVAAMHRLADGVCVVGKSMILRRETLEAIGGLRSLSRVLAEDQVSGEEVARIGLRVTVANVVVDNVLGTQSVKTFLARHLRWAKIRRRMNPVGYAGEVLLSPTFIAACGELIVHRAASAVVLAAAFLAETALAIVAERAAGVRRPLAAYPLLVALRSVLAGTVWIVPFFSSTVRWRGNRLRIGSRTLLDPAVQDPAVMLDPASAGARGYLF